MRLQIRSTALLITAAVALAACGGGDDDAGSLFDDVGGAAEETGDDPGDEVTDNAADDDASAAGAADEGVGFGGFVSGEIVVSGGEAVSFAVGDPALAFTSGGGCGGQNYGISVNVQDATARTTLAQISAGVDEDLSGGRTGSFPVEEVTFMIAPDGDMMALRSYEGPGTLEVVEHDNAAPSFDLNSRRTTLSISGTLEASGPDETGTVELDADLVWVMGCP